MMSYYEEFSLYVPFRVEYGIITPKWTNYSKGRQLKTHENVAKKEHKMADRDVGGTIGPWYGSSSVGFIAHCGFGGGRGASSQPITYADANSQTDGKTDRRAKSFQCEYARGKFG